MEQNLEVTIVLIDDNNDVLNTSGGLVDDLKDYNSDGLKFTYQVQTASNVNDAQKLISELDPEGVYIFVLDQHISSSDLGIQGGKSAIDEGSKNPGDGNTLVALILNEFGDCSILVSNTGFNAPVQDCDYVIPQKRFADFFDPTNSFSLKRIEEHIFRGFK